MCLEEKNMEDNLNPERDDRTEQEEKNSWTFGPFGVFSLFGMAVFAFLIIAFILGTMFGFFYGTVPGFVVFAIVAVGGAWLLYKAMLAEQD